MSPEYEHWNSFKINNIQVNLRHATDRILHSGKMQFTLSTISFALTTVVVAHAWYQKQQFYPAVVYVTKSNASMAVICNTLNTRIENYNQ